MDLTRIAIAIDIERTQKATITLVGAGGSAGLIQNFARCGVRKFLLIDPDTVSRSNIARQEHHPDRVGRMKVDAVAEMILRINPAAEIVALPKDFLAMSDREIDAVAGGSDVLVFATDRFAAQARGNEVALRLDRPAMWIGLYPSGLAGEIVFWHSEIDACYRCLCPSRYANHATAALEGKSLDPSSDGCTIFDITLLDTIAGMIGIGLLTRGSDTRYGRLIDALGNRNFIQVQLSPEWTVNGRDLVHELLGVEEGCPNYFAWNTVVRRDPDDGKLPCADCERFRGHFFHTVEGKPVRGKCIIPPGAFH
ncbi:MAG: HesA/MoeB/ThiF family protein [Pirellulaceae bacterium]